MFKCRVQSAEVSLVSNGGFDHGNFVFQTRYSGLLELVRKGGGDKAVWRHTQRNKKLFVWERLKLLLDHESFLELSSLAGLDMPYGDVPAAGCLTGNGSDCHLDGKSSLNMIHVTSKDGFEFRGLF